jgi:hypothetical protein
MNIIEYINCWNSSSTSFRIYSLIVALLINAFSVFALDTFYLSLDDELSATERVFYGLSGKKAIGERFFKLAINSLI